MAGSLGPGVSAAAESCGAATTKSPFLDPQWLLPVYCRFPPVSHLLGLYTWNRSRRRLRLQVIQCAARHLIQGPQRFGVLCDWKKSEAVRKATNYWFVRLCQPHSSSTLCTRISFYFGILFSIPWRNHFSRLCCH